MATVDLKQAASTGVDHLQSAIDVLNGLKLDPNANIPAIDAKIQLLEDKQTDLSDLRLKAIEDSPENKAAIDAINAAAAALKSAASEMTADASALTQVAAIVSAAASLASALAPFIL